MKASPGGIALEEGTLTLEGITRAFSLFVQEADETTIDNTRLGYDQRCAVVVNGFEDFSADVTLAFSPGSFASLKEKPYYQEVVQKLMRSNAQFEQHSGRR